VDVICLACPMCHSNLDLRQAEYAGGGVALPVLYLTQLIGLAFGLKESNSG
jgi:heterodisulfide reductase subunit B2